jgi:hypothetical protein
VREAGERQRAKAKEDAFASGAKPRLEERVREQRRRPTSNTIGDVGDRTEAARRRTSDAADTEAVPMPKQSGGREWRL